MERFAQVHGARPLAVDGEIDAVIAQDANQQIDVGQIGHVFESEPVLGQQAGD